MAMSIIHREYKRAKADGRQPICPFCHEPLEITQTQSLFIYWKWNSEKRYFDMGIPDGDADKPYCVSCGIRDWDFIDHGLIDFKDEMSEVKE